MNSNPQVASFPKHVNEVISETFNIYNSINDDNKTYANCLIMVLKKYHLWPNIKVKKFKNLSDIVLLHNNYKMGEIYEYRELYEQCRSIVLDFTQSFNNNIVVTYANSIPIRCDQTKYVTELYSDTDKCYEAYDGTMITVYNHNGEWYFGTSSCPDANSSKFSHPTKTHGNMFDEILYKIYSNQLMPDENNLNYADMSKLLRSKFVAYLDPNLAYEFIIVHHENIHIIDYTNFLGENYKELVHVNTKNRNTLVEEDVFMTRVKDFEAIGINYPKEFSNINEATGYINSNPYSYGLIIKKKTADNTIKLYKVSTDIINHREETDPCHPNTWMNILGVYMKNKHNYTVKDYISTYVPNLILPLDNNNRHIDPTYLVHTIISTIKDSLYSYYLSTTTYYPKYGRYKMNKDLDKQFPPIIQYHLAQLRNLQVSTYKDKMITSANIYYYLCQCNDAKNIKTLIQFFASNPINEMNPRTSMCFAIMNSLIS
jgi:hypothetical protein